MRRNFEAFGLAVKGWASVARKIAGLGFPELSPIIAVATAGIVLTTDVYCTTDPPADPGAITLGDIAAAVDPANQPASANALVKIRDWFLHWYWWTACQCTTVSTPTGPTPTLPTGYGGAPGLPPAANSSPCWDRQTQAFLGQALGAGPPASLDMTANLPQLGAGLRRRHRLDPGHGPGRPRGSDDGS